MESGKRENLNNGGDIILVTGVPSAGKSTLINNQLKVLAHSYGIPDERITVINDAEEVSKSVEEAERNQEGGFYRKKEGGFVITDTPEGRKILKRAYERFFFAIAGLEDTGYPVFVEWAGGKKKEDVEVEGADHSYETIGMIFAEYAKRITPRVWAVLNLVTSEDDREAWREQRKGANARGPTVANLLHTNDFRTIADRFFAGKVFDVGNFYGTRSVWVESRGTATSETPDQFLAQFFAPFKLWSKIDAYKSEPTDDNYAMLREAYGELQSLPEFRQLVREGKGQKKRGIDIHERPQDIESLRRAIEDSIQKYRNNINPIINEAEQRYGRLGAFWPDTFTKTAAALLWLKMSLAPPSEIADQETRLAALYKQFPPELQSQAKSALEPVVQETIQHINVYVEATWQQLLGMGTGVYTRTEGRMTNYSPLRRRIETALENIRNPPGQGQGRS